MDQCLKLYEEYIQQQGSEGNKLALMKLMAECEKVSKNATTAQLAILIELLPDCYLKHSIQLQFEIQSKDYFNQKGGLLFKTRTANETIESINDIDTLFSIYKSNDIDNESKELITKKLDQILDQEVDSIKDDRHVVDCNKLSKTHLVLSNEVSKRAMKRHTDLIYKSYTFAIANDPDKAYIAKLLNDFNDYFFEIHDEVGIYSMIVESFGSVESMMPSELYRRMNLRDSFNYSLKFKKAIDNAMKLACENAIKGLQNLNSILDLYEYTANPAWRYRSRGRKNHHISGFIDACDKKSLQLCKEAVLTLSSDQIAQCILPYLTVNTKPYRYITSKLHEL